MAAIIYSWDHTFNQAFSKSVRPIQEIYNYTKMAEIKIHIKPRVRFHGEFNDLTMKKLAAAVDRVEFCSIDSNSIRDSYEELTNAVTDRTLRLLDSNFIFNDVLAILFAEQSECIEWGLKYDVNKYFVKHLSPLYTLLVDNKLIYLGFAQFLELIEPEIEKRYVYEMELRSQLWYELANHYQRNIQFISAFHNPNQPLVGLDQPLPHRVIIELLELLKGMKFIDNRYSAVHFERTLLTLFAIDSKQYAKSKSDYYKKAKMKFKRLSAIIDELSSESDI